MSLLPTTPQVARAWLRLVVPAGVRVGDRLPPLDAALRDSGFVRTEVVGGSTDRDVPFHRPVVAAECWLAPHATTGRVSWDAVDQLAAVIEAATFDPAFMGRVVDLPGDFAPARVHTVIALGSPQRVPDDPGDFARADLDLQIHWTGA